MIKTIATLTAAAVFGMYITALAQEQAPAQMPAPTHEMTAPSQAQTQAPAMGEEKKGDKPAKGAHGKGKARGHAKKTKKTQPNQ